MTEITSQYSVGDWVVHHAYGIGQIEKIVKKPIQGDLVSCFQVKTKNGAQWWFPSNNTDNPRIRPVVSQNLLQQAEKELQEPILGLDPDKAFWKDRINEVTTSGDFMATSQILRDLTVLKNQRKLNQMEVKAFNLFKDRLLSEWSTTMNIDIEIVRVKLRDYLEVCSARAVV